MFFPLSRAVQAELRGRPGPLEESLSLLVAAVLTDGERLVREHPVKAIVAGWLLGYLIGRAAASGDDYGD